MNKIDQAKAILTELENIKAQSGTTKTDRRNLKSLILLSIKPRLAKLNLTTSDIEELLSWKKGL
jgi:hypothetical protein